MGDTYICDGCDRRIDSGYSIAWAKTLTDSPAGIHWDFSGNETVNLCRECFPDEHKTVVERVRDMIL